MSNLLSLLDRAFYEDDFFRPVTSTFANALARSVSAVPLNIKEYDDRYEIEIALPKVDPKKVKIEIQGQSLTISYESEDKENNKEDRGKEYVRREWYCVTSFYRQLILDKIDSEQAAEAEYERGVLTIRVNKKSSEKPKNVEIKIKE